MEFGEDSPVMSDLRGFLNIEQLIKLLENMKQRNIRDYALFFTLYKSGRRISELLALKVEDIDFENQKILWNILKRRIQFRRWIDEDVEVLFVLKQYLQTTGLREGSFLFPITRQRAFDIIRFYCKRVGINFIGEKKPHPHHLRHTFAIHFIRSGDAKIEDLFALKYKLGHKTIASTETYLQFGDTILKERLKDIPSLLRKKATNSPNNNDTGNNNPVTKMESVGEENKESHVSKEKSNVSDN